MSLPAHIKEVFAKSTCIHSKSDIEEALDRMAYEISNQLQDTNPVLLCVMIGGLVPMGNLLPRLNFPLELDYVQATRYRSGLSAGELEWKVEPRTDLKDRTVLVIDDILDGGITLGKIIEYCNNKGAKDVFSGVLVDKYHERDEGGLDTADFTGLRVEDKYVFGYGLDYKEYLRNAPGIYVVADEHAK